MLALLCNLSAKTSVFTGQVEMKRVGIPPHVPCAVQQWEGLIASKLGPYDAAGCLLSTCEPRMLLLSKLLPDETPMPLMPGSLIVLT